MATRRQSESTDYLNPELEGVIDFSSLATGGQTVQPVTEREFAMNQEGKMAYEAFMQEPLVIVIHATSNPNEPEVCEVGLNGVTVNVPRDRPVRLPRAFVENIARSQTRTYSQRDVRDPMATEGKMTKRHTGTDYAFRVIHDPNPKGGAWLRRVMHESA